jgi:hypothetical protein
MGTAAKTDQLKASGERDPRIIHLRRGAGGRRGRALHIQPYTDAKHATGQITADECRWIVNCRRASSMLVLDR